MSSREEIESLLNKARKQVGINPAAGLELCRQARQLAEEDDDLQCVAFSMLLSGACQNKRAKFQAAEANLSQALVVFKELEDLPGQAETLTELGFCMGELGNNTRSLEFLLQSLVLWQKLGQSKGLALCLNHLGNRYYYFGQFDLALEYYQQSLAIRESICDQTGMAQCFNNMAIIYDKFGNYDQALEYYQESLDIYEARAMMVDAANALLNMAGMLNECLNQPVQAKEAYLRAQEFVQLTDNKLFKGLVLQGLGNVAREQQDYSLAQTYFANAFALLNETGSLEMLAELFLDQGEFQIAQQDLEGALSSYQRALEIASQQSTNETAFLAHEGLSEAYEQKGDFALALQHHKEFHRLREMVFSSQTALKVKGLLLKAETDRALRDAEIYRLKNEELSRAHQDLQNALEENQKLLQELQLKTEDLLLQVWQDSLTGIHNRRYLEMRLDEETERALRLGHDLAVVMIDVDDFKYINDRLSHTAGDMVLKAVSRLFKEESRSVDVVGRYGGDEFMFILIETDPEQAVVACERLCNTISRYDWDTIHPYLHVTVSMGISTLRKKQEKRSLIEIADDHLYLAKRQGKNRVVG